MFKGTYGDYQKNQSIRGGNVMQINFNAVTPYSNQLVQGQNAPQQAPPSKGGAPGPAADAPTSQGIPGGGAPAGNHINLYV